MPLEITTKHSSSREEQVMHALNELISKYDLSRLEYASKILIDDEATPDDAATLDTKNLNNPGQLLSQYINVQCHVFVKWRKAEVETALEELANLYPHKDTTYLTKIVVATMEYHELRKIIESTAITVLQNKHRDADIYATVLEDAAQLNALLEKHKLLR